MSTQNEVRLIGNLGADPQIKPLENGGAIASFSVATTEKIKSTTGEVSERTSWHRVVVFGKLVEIVQSNLKKGSKVLLLGSLRTRNYTDKQGHEVYVTEIVLDSCYLLDIKKKGE